MKETDCCKTKVMSAATVSYWQETRAVLECLEAIKELVARTFSLIFMHLHCHTHVSNWQAK